MGISMPNLLGTDHFGIYVHWPFCAAKCPYCDFNSHVASHIDHRTWADAYVSEIHRLRATIGARTVTSIFFGGGTPSLMDPHTVSDTISAIQREFGVANDVEITLEANPTSSEANKFRDFQLAGVNRVSIGVQSLRDSDLKRLGRQHTAAEAISTVTMARDIFPSVSFDLMYGRQNQSLEAWDAELREALSFTPDHISLYQLTVEPSTAFGRLYDNGKLNGLPNDDLSYELFERTQSICSDHGLMQYEVSNFARSGHMSRHNRTYWRYQEYAGIGPGAHGRLYLNNAACATETELSPETWLSVAQHHNTSPAQTLSRISSRDQSVEMLLMGLRLHEGVEIERWLAAQEAVDVAKVDLLEQDGLVRRSPSHVALTPAGRPLLNAILREIIK